MNAESRFDLVEEGDRTALICIDEPDTQSSIVRQVDAQNYKIHTGMFAEDVTLKLTAQQYDLVVVSDSFNGSDLDSNPVISTFQQMAVRERRSTFVVVIGPDFATNNGMQAFQHSVDLVCAVSDVLSFGPVLRRALDRHNSFYAAYKHCVSLAVSI